ncbi:MAG: hypothetical protein MHM6MM_004917 [Cercozoa sp. M6MM]
MLILTFLPPSRVFDFVGANYDALTGVVWTREKKAAAFIKLCLKLATTGQQTITLVAMQEFAGKAAWRARMYSIGQPFLAPAHHAANAVPRHARPSRPCNLSNGVREAACFMLQVEQRGQAKQHNAFLLHCESAVHANFSTDTAGSFRIAGVHLEDTGDWLAVQLPAEFGTDNNGLEAWAHALGWLVDAWRRDRWPQRFPAHRSRSALTDSNNFVLQSRSGRAKNKQVRAALLLMQGVMFGTDARFWPKHIPGKDNKVADALSRDDMPAARRHAEAAGVQLKAEPMCPRVIKHNRFWRSLRKSADFAADASRTTRQIFELLDSILTLQ